MHTDISFAHLIIVPALALTTATRAQQLSSPFDEYFSVHQVGVPALPNDLGGLAVDPANPDKLLVVSHGSTVDSKIWSFDVVRGPGGHIEALAELPPQLVCTASAPDGGVFGSLLVAPDGTLLFTNFSGNDFVEVLPGDSMPSFVLPLEPYGVPDYPSGIAVVPTGWCGSGRLTMLKSSLQAPGLGSVSFLLFQVPTGQWLLGDPGDHMPLDHIPTGITYLPDSCLTTELGRLVLVCHNFDGKIAAYRPAALSEPDRSTAQTFLEVFGPRGITTDPVTGDLLFIARLEVDTVFAVRLLGECRCAGDIDGSGVVDGADLGALLTAWGATECVAAGADGTFDGQIDGADLGLLLANWGRCRW